MDLLVSNALCWTWSLLTGKKEWLVNLKGEKREKKKKYIYIEKQPAYSGVPPFLPDKPLG